MKQHFQAPRPTVMSLSMEEEAIVISEIMAEENDAQRAIDEVNRVEASAQALEDVILIGQSAQDLSDTRGLMQAVAEMGVAGTEMAPESIMPAVAMSLEDIKDIKETLVNIWRTIVSMLKQMWGHIKAAFGKYQMLLHSYEQKLKGLREKASKLGGDQVRGGTKIEIAMAKRPNMTPKNGDQILENWDIINHALKIVLVDGVQGDVAIGALTKKLVEGIAYAYSRSVDPRILRNNVAPIMDNFVKSMEALGGANDRFFKVVQSSKNGVGNVVGLTPELPGGLQLQLHVKYENQQTDGDATYDKLRAYLSSYVKLDQADERLSLTDAVEIDLPPPDVLVRIIDEALKACVIANSYLDNGQAKLTQAHVDIEKASQRLVDLISKNSSAQGEAGVAARVQTILRMNKHYGAMVSATGGGMLKMLQQQVGATGSFATKCLSSYNGRETEETET